MQRLVTYRNVALELALLHFFSTTSHRCDVIERVYNKLEKNEWPGWPEFVPTVDRVSKNLGKMAVRPVRIDSLSSGGSSLSHFHRFFKSANLFSFLRIVVIYCHTSATGRGAVVYIARKEETSMPDWQCHTRLNALDTLFRWPILETVNLNEFNPRIVKRILHQVTSSVTYSI